MHVFDSNGPEVRIRGTAHQVYEKYLGLARDASGSGDRVASENQLQPAEHYYRIILAQNEAERQARGGFDQPQPGISNPGQNTPASDGGFGDEGDNPFDQSIGFAGSPNPFFAQQPPRVNAPPNNGGGQHGNGGHHQGERQGDRQQHGGSQGQPSGDRPYGNQSQGHERPRRERYSQPQERGERNDRGAPMMEQPRIAATSHEGAQPSAESVSSSEQRDARSEISAEAVRRPRRPRGHAGEGRARTDVPPTDDAD